MTNDRNNFDPKSELRIPDDETVKRSIEGIKAAAGSWQDLVDAEEFKAYVIKRRQLPGRPPVKL